MNPQKNIGIISVLTPVWFLIIYMIMASIRPEYSHLTKAISELGSLDATNLWYWNILGYIFPGLSICALGIGLKMEFPNYSKIPAYALMLSGLLMSLSGVFPGDFENRESFTMIMHTIGSFGSFMAFLVAGFWYPTIFRKNPHWKSLAWISLFLVVMSLMTGFLRSSEASGLGQRLGFACYFGWVLFVGYFLYRSSSLVKNAQQCLKT